MIRTIISLSENSKQWLDRYSKRHHLSIAATLRMALKQFQMQVGDESCDELLKRTAGILKNGEDSVKSIRRLRDEWEK
jgi:hypothetical protein